jgi:hypothetical protein
MSLVSPSGRTIDRSTTAPDVSHDKGAAFEVYSVTNPEPGNWQVSLFGADVPVGGEDAVFGFSTVPAEGRPTSAGSPPCTPANNCFFNLPAPSPSPSPSPSPTPVPTPAVLPSLGIGATTALGANPTSGYSAKSLKVQAKGKYVTWRFTGGAAMAGQRLTIMVSTASSPGVWGPWKPLTVRVADATGSATFKWKSTKAISISIRAVCVGNDKYADSLSPARGVTWR